MLRGHSEINMPVTVSVVRFYVFLLHVLVTILIVSVQPFFLIYVVFLFVCLFVCLFVLCFSFLINRSGI
jgi:hypothetical protein